MKNVKTVFIVSSLLMGCKGGINSPFSSELGIPDSNNKSTSTTAPQTVVPTGKVEVSCENVEIYNSELERVNALIRECSFASYEEDITSATPLVELKRSSIGNYGKADLNFNYSSSELRTHDLPNLFYGVNVQASCNDWTGRLLGPAYSNQLSLDIYESYTNSIFYGGQIAFPGTPNYKFRAQFKKENQECLSLDRSQSGETVHLSKNGELIYRTETDTAHDITLRKKFAVRKEIIGNTEWSLKEDKNFDSCSVKPKKLDIHMSTQISVGGTNTGFSNKPISSMVYIGSKISGRHNLHHILNTTPCSSYGEYNCDGLSPSQCLQ